MLRTLGSGLGLLGGAALLGAGIEIALFVQEGGDLAWLLVLFPVAGLVYVAAGLVAWWRRPSNRIGAILVGGGLVWMLAALGGVDIPELAAVGVVLATVVLAVPVHLLHAFPSGRLRTPISRWTVITGYATCLVLQVPVYLFTPANSPNGMLAAADRPGLATAGVWLQRGVGIAAMIVTAVLLAGRLHAANRPQRRVLAPLYGYGIVAVLLVPLLPDAVVPLNGISTALSNALQIGLMSGIPIAFSCAMLLGGFARTSEVQELGAWLGTSVAARPPLGRALARALGDPSLQLLFWADDRRDYVDVDGHPAALPAAGSEQSVVDVALGHRRIAAIVYDSTLIEDGELVRAAGRVTALAIDRQRLTAELLASRDALRASRARIVETALQERRRVAQQLHDGLQGELVLLALQAQQLADCPSDTGQITASATALRRRIDLAARELREPVHAVMPAALVERGLAAATDDLVIGCPSRPVST